MILLKYLKRELDRHYTVDIFILILRTLYQLINKTPGSGCLLLNNAAFVTVLICGSIIPLVLLQILPHAFTMSTTETESSSSGSTAGSQCSSPTPSPEHTCAHCNEKYKQPRVLPCLHVFCTSCITELATDALNVLGRSVTCPLCQQCITLPVGGVEALPLDHVLVELLDMLAIHDMQIVCTSCKAREKALARCSDCANFLCPNCVTAHRYMRCFENHKVGGRCPKNYCKEIRIFYVMLVMKNGKITIYY